MASKDGLPGIFETANSLGNKKVSVQLTIRKRECSSRKKLLPGHSSRLTFFFLNRSICLTQLLVLRCPNILAVSIVLHCSFTLEWFLLEKKSTCFYQHLFLHSDYSEQCFFCVVCHAPLFTMLSEQSSPVL